MNDDVLVEGDPVVLVDEPAGVLAFSTATPALRPRWFDGRLLAPAVLTIEQSYRRFLAAASAGSGGAGVVDGLEVDTTGAPSALRFTVAPGLAVAATGRLLVLESTLEIARAVLLPGAGPGTPMQLFVLTLVPAEQVLQASGAGSPSHVREVALLRARPHLWRLPPATKGAPLDPTLHLRSLAASDYLRAARGEQAALTTAKGLRSTGWCRGAGRADGDEVPLALVAMASGQVVFIDRWAARRERIVEPPARRAAFVTAMRPLDLFLAEVLQFQCQLAGDEGVQPLPGAPPPAPAPAPALCPDLQGVLGEVHGAFSDLINADDTRVMIERREVAAVDELPLPGGRTGLFAITAKLAQQLAPPIQPAQSQLVQRGFVELPPAGYLPVTAQPSVNEQARALFGPGVDVRVCVTRPDFLAHALEEAQHMDRISLVAGLGDAARRPEVDVLVPDGIARTAPPPQGAYALQVRLGADKQSPGHLRGTLRLDGRADGGLTAHAA